MAVQSDAPAQNPAPAQAGALHALTSRAERFASTTFVLPAVLVVLFLSIFPLVISLYLSLSRFQLVKGGFDIRFIGLLNYRKLLVGSEQEHFLGALRPLSPLGWLLLAGVAALLLAGLARYARGRDRSAMGLVWRIVGAAGAGWLAWLLARTLLSGGRPGTLIVTCIYVFVGILLQYLLGLGL